MEATSTEIPKPTTPNAEPVVAVPVPQQKNVEPVEPPKSIQSNIPEKSDVLKAEHLLAEVKTPRTLYDAPKEETGWDRLRAMYYRDDLGYRSGELNFVLQGAASGALAGLLFGGVVGGRLALHDFIRKNESTTFHGALDGRRRLNDHVMLGTMRNSFRWGARLGLFSGTYLLTVMTVAVYRNKSSLIEYITGGGLSGALYKVNLGIRGICAGGLVGSALGTVAGSLSLTAMWLTGTSIEEIRYWKNIHKLKRQSEVYEQIVKKREEKDIDPLALAHDANLKAGLKS